MAMTANKIFWTEFIDIYRSLPSLWNTKDENYHNREIRSLGWNKLVEKLQEVEPDANQDSVKRKINTFRSNFNREVRKIRHAEKEHTTEVYNPTLWYFDHLSFLLIQEKYNNGTLDSHYDEEMTLMGLTNSKHEKMFENETMHSESINQEHMMENEQNPHYEKLIKHKPMLRLRFRSNSHDEHADLEQKPLIKYTPDNEVLQTEPTHPVHESIIETQNFVSSENHIKPLKNIKYKESAKTATIARTSRSNPKRSKLRLKSQDPYSTHQFRYNFLSSISTDEAAIYGQTWACGFRKLCPQQKLFAKKAIDEILILGQLKALKLNTVNINANLFEETSDQS